MAKTEANQASHGNGKIISIALSHAAQSGFRAPLMPASPPMPLRFR